MNQEFLKELSGQLPDLEIKKNEPMAKHTTFKVGGPADIYVTPDIKALDTILKLAKEYNIPLTIIGNGSNLLVTDKGIRGLVVEIGKAMESIKISGTTITVGAGTLMSRAANAAAEAGLGGMEFAAGIPGSIGGAVVMNAGAYGGEMVHIVKEAKLVSKDGSHEYTMSCDELQLSYRHSILHETGDIVVSVTLQLEEGNKEEISATMKELAAKRNEKQPVHLPSAGSFFKRPEGYFAGKLVQDAGMKGFSVGAAQVSPLHSGFIVNNGGATATEILQLMEIVQAAVMEQFGVKLEPEVRIIG